MKKMTKIGFMNMGFVLLALAGCQNEASPKAPGVTLENFQQVVVGDEITGAGGSSYEEVVSLFGESPALEETVDMGENQLVQTQWYNEDESDERYMSVNFTNGLASYKGQHGYGA